MVYIDADFKCYLENAPGRTAAQTDFFDDKCGEYTQGYRYIPYGHTWTREDGTIFTGEMIVPWIDYSILDSAQREYERQELADMKAALAELGVE